MGLCCFSCEGGAPQRTRVAQTNKRMRKKEVRNRTHRASHTKQAGHHRVRGEEWGLSLGVKKKTLTRGAGTPNDTNFSLERQKKIFVSFRSDSIDVSVFP